MFPLWIIVAGIAVFMIIFLTLGPLGIEGDLLIAGWFAVFMLALWESIAHVRKERQTKNQRQSDFFNSVSRKRRRAKPRR